MRRDAHNRWLGPSLAALACALGGLTLWLDGGEISGRDLLPRDVLVGVIVVAWLLEAVGFPWPRLAFAATVSLAVGALIALGWDLFAPIILIVTSGWAAYSGTRRASLVALLLAIGSLIPPFFIRWENQEDWISFIFAWVAMRALVTQQETSAALRAAQAEIARQSAAAERRRIAREVHDVIAHSLAITMLHLTGARHILARDPARAAEGLAQAERLGRQSLADIRRTVSLLNDPDGARPDADSPLPGAGDIPELVAGYARAGLDARLDLTGDPAALSPAAGLDLYRITQEALANVAKHAPGARVEVALAIGPDRATLRVRDSGAAPGATPLVASPAAAGGSGLGLLGMRERVAMHGGSLTAARDGAGRLVECVVPMQ